MQLYRVSLPTSQYCTSC